MANSDELKPSMSSADMTSTGIAADGKRLVITVRMADQVLPELVSAGHGRSVGVLLLPEDGTDSRDGYTVTFDWKDRTVTISTGGGPGRSVARAHVADAAAEAEIPLADVSLLGTRFKWHAQSVANRPVEFAGSPGLMIGEDACPATSREQSFLHFVSGPLPTTVAPPSTAATVTTPASSGPPPTGATVVGITGSGGGDGTVVDPGPDCTTGASACSYDNGIDFSVLRSSIADGVAPVLGVRPEVDCDRPNTEPPNHVRVGKTLTCVFDMEFGVFGEVEVRVRPNGAWDWRVLRTGVD